MSLRTLPVVAVTDWLVIDAMRQNDVWLRVNLNLIQRDVDTLLDVPCTDEPDPVLGHALGVLGTMWHRCADYLADAGYPHPDANGKPCDTERCAACNGEER